MSRTYKGDSLEEIKILKFGDGSKRKFYPYFAGKALMEALNLAIYLKRPLLLMGEPGCGKSVLASTLAYEWYHEKPETFKEKFHRWDIKSRTEAQDGIYLYDAIARLRLSERDPKIIDEEQKHKGNPEALTRMYINNGFLEEGPLKKAIDASTQDEPAILLIDEIDKASIDFPNDLLLEMDKFQYSIKETGYQSAAKSEEDYPIVIITSNNEKPLPAAFLRRCIYHYIHFPDEGTLKQILEARYKVPQEDDLNVAAVQLFDKIRRRLSDQDPAKSISTAELINWFEGLIHPENQKADLVAKLNTILETLKNQSNAKVEIPLHYALLKTYDALLAILPENLVHPPQNPQS